jgi:hypothetical protein
VRTLLASHNTDILLANKEIYNALRATDCVIAPTLISSNSTSYCGQCEHELGISVRVAGIGCQNGELEANLCMVEEHRLWDVFMAVSMIHFFWGFPPCGSS